MISLSTAGSADRGPATLGTAGYDTGMWLYLTKIVVSVAVIVAVSEISKTSSFVGGLLASLPLISLLSFTWLYVETGDSQKVAALSTSIFWLVLPSLVLFVVLPPLLLRVKLSFALSLALSTAAMLASYGLMLLVLRGFGVKL